MAEFLLELYSEEIPPKLQIDARNNLLQSFKNILVENNIKCKNLEVFSCPTRIVVYINNLPIKIKKPEIAIKGPKVGVPDNILQNFVRSHNVSEREVFKKEIEKGSFYFIKKKSEEIYLENIFSVNLPKILGSLTWKKSMKWGDNSLLWGRPLRSIFAIFEGKILRFNFNHLKSNDQIIIEKDLIEKLVKIRTFKNYKSLMRLNRIFFNHNERENLIKTKFELICKKYNYNLNLNSKLLDEVINIVENPNILLASFSKEYLNLPNEIIISTLQVHQRYFPLFDKKKDKLSNFFLVVANKPDNKNLIKMGNKRVVEARLADAKFFWDKDKSKNLIKQIGKLKKITFYDKIGSIYDKTQRMRKLAGLISDDLNINKEKVEIAASISKSDLSSDLIGEYPELQGVMGKYFALAQGFEADVANAISDHYLPIGNNSIVPKKPISISIAVADKIDSLVGFFLINEKPTSSKDPFALRRSAIGLLRIIVENKLNLKIRDLINYNINLFLDQEVKSLNQNTEKEILGFLKDRMKNILREKKIKPDIIEASLSSHMGDNYYELYKKNLLISKYINKEVGQNALSSYKRAFNIIEKEGKNIEGKPDAVLFRKKEEENLYTKINEIQKAFTVKEEDKNYEDLLVNLSKIKPFTDNFFDNVVVNDENNDIKNNRLELLKMFCNTFNNFVNFSKLEGI
tara:strand:+ start:1851 stop:3908 length:2058 start_codon:yes stop_codon:yes gene_type:complete